MAQLRRRLQPEPKPKPKPKSKPKPKPEQAHEIWQISELVGLIAEALLDSNDVYDISRTSHAIKQDLRNFRLVNKLFSEMGTKHLFLRIRSDVCNRAGQYFEGLRQEQRELADRCVRSLEYHSSRCHRLQPLDRRNRDLIPAQHREFTVCEFANIVRLFPRLSHVAFSSPTFSLEQVIGSLVWAEVRLDALTVSVPFALSVENRNRLMRDPSVRELFSALKTFEIFDCTSGHYGRISVAIKQRCDFLKSLFTAAKSLLRLSLHDWQYLSDSTGILNEIEPPVHVLHNLRSIHLLRVSLTDETLLNMVASSKNSLESLRLGYIRLRSGYWSRILNEIEGLLPRLTDLWLEDLDYRLQPHKRSALTVTKKSPYSDKYGPLVTLNSNDRAAWKSLCEVHQQYTTVGVVLAGLPRRYMMQKKGGYMVEKKVLCAAYMKSGKRCNEQTLVTKKADLEVHSRGSGDSQARETVNVWLCSSHEEEHRHRFTVWPWEVAHS